MHLDALTPVQKSPLWASGSNEPEVTVPLAHGGVRAESTAAEARPSARLRGRGAGGRRRARTPWPFPGLAPGAAKSFQPKSTAPTRAANRRT